MYRAGVDLGGTNIVAGIVSEDLKIIGRSKIKTNRPRPAEEILDDVASAVGAAIKDAGVSRDEILCVGVGTPGSVNKKTGYIEFANNLDFNNVPAKEILERKIGKTVYLDNDANCAALGEAIAGVGKGVRSLVAVTLGTGFGSGVIINGKIVGGVNYAAGEIGHTVVKFDGKPCNCGRRGCLEQYASATALIEQTKEAMLKNRGCKMWSLVNGDIDAVNGKTAFDGARMNDPEIGRAHV